MTKRVTIKCQNCGRKFRVELCRAKTAKYHNFQCAQEGRSRSTAAARGNKKRGTGSGKSYIKIRGRFIHQRVAEMLLGRKLRKNEVSHHKDENKRNNDPMNIEVVTRAQHMAIHRKAILAARKRKCGW